MITKGTARDAESMVLPTIIVLGDPPLLEITLRRPVPGPAGEFFLPTRTLRRWCCISDGEGRELSLRAQAGDQVLYPMVDGLTNEDGFMVPPGRFVVFTETGHLPATARDDFLDGLRIFPPHKGATPPGSHASADDFQGLPLSRRQMADLTTVLTTPDLGAYLVGHVPLLERIRLRQVSPAARAAVDGSLLQVTKLCAEDLYGLKGSACLRAIEWLAPKCSALTELRAPGTIDFITNAGGPKWFLTDASLKLVAQHCRSLERLDVGKPSRTVDLIAIVSPAQAEVKLAVQRQLGIELVAGDDGITAVAEHCQGLRELEVSVVRVTNAALVSLGRHAPNLERLVLHDLDVLPVYSMLRERIAESTTGNGYEILASGCPRLKSLIIPDSGLCDKGLIALGKGCPRLEELDMAGCSKITNAGISALAENFSGFKSLRVSRCPEVTDAGLEPLIWHGKELQSLEANLCPGVTDATCRGLAAHCPKLEGVCLAWNPGVTDAGLSEVAARCPLLRKLFVKDCPGVSDTTMALLGQNCRHLQLLNVEGCPEVTDDGVWGVVKQCKDLRLIKFAGSGVSQECQALLDEHLWRDC